MNSGDGIRRHKEGAKLVGYKGYFTRFICMNPLWRCFPVIVGYFSFWFGNLYGLLPVQRGQSDSSSEATVSQVFLD